MYVAGARLGLEFILRFNHNVSPSPYLPGEGQSCESCGPISTGFDFPIADKSWLCLDRRTLPQQPRNYLSCLQLTKTTAQDI